MYMTLVLALQAMEHPEKRVPLLTSSTESFKIGLKSYAQLPGPKHGYFSIPACPSLHCVGASKWLPLTLSNCRRYSAGQDLSPVKSVRGAKATASTAQVLDKPCSIAISALCSVHLQLR